MGVGWPLGVVNKEVGQPRCSVGKRGEQNGGGRGEDNSNRGTEDKRDGG